MNLKQRIAYYLGGFSLGLILLFFFLGGKETSCAYGPEARVLKNLNIKERKISVSAWSDIQSFNLDTSQVFRVLRMGDVIFSESNTGLDSCKQYIIKGFINEKSYKLNVENCEDFSQILSVIASD